MSFKDSGPVENVVNLMDLSTNQSAEFLSRHFVILTLVLFKIPPKQKKMVLFEIDSVEGKAEEETRAFWF